MKLPLVPCNGFYYDPKHIKIERDEKNRSVMKVIGFDGGVIDTEGLVKKNGDSMTGNLDMRGNNISDVDVIANQVSVQTTDKTSAMHIRMNDETKELSICKETPETGENLPLGVLNVDDPTNETHAVNKRYLEYHFNSFVDNQANADIDMKNHSIINAGKLATNGVMPVFVGNVIEPPSVLKGVRYGANTDGSGAIIKASTQDEYIPLYVGEPKEPNHSATKKYVDDEIKKLSATVSALSTSLDTANQKIEVLTQYKVKYEDLMKRLANEV